jgi:two-component system response regulator HupR/HoxA
MTSETVNKSKFSILVVDDEKASLNAIKRVLRHEFEIELALNAKAAIDILNQKKISIILADQRMPEMSGVELFQESLKIQPDAVRILITGYTDIEAIIKAINIGEVYFYINKPWEPDELRFIMKRAAERYNLLLENKRLLEELKIANKKLEQENIILRQEVEKTGEFGNIIGNSKKMKEVFNLVRKVTQTDLTVLILGETGTGKELIARAIHFNSPRKHRLFMVQNCGALPDTLLESELFGHVKGAFTGATTSKKGLFELADGGTIFLDEISDTSTAFQQRLLRVLQEQEIRPLGGEKNIKVDVRIISATNKDLRGMVNEGKFREDLFFRINVFPIYIPPLRERREDIPLLIDHFIQKYQKKLQKNISHFESHALQILTSAEYPGNIRELENEIQRAITLASAGSIVTSDLLSDSLKSRPAILESLLNQSGNLKELTESLEKTVIMEKLKEHNGNITHTARALGLSRLGLQKKIQRYQLKI